MAFLEVSDLAAFAEIDAAKAEEMIHDASALAVLVAPCLDDEMALTANQFLAVRAVLRSAILRWHDSGNGALQSEGIGSYNYTIDTRQQRRGLFFPSEIAQLQTICKNDTLGGAFAIDTHPTGGITHAEMCSLYFGANYCSCGAVLTQGSPLWNTP